MTSLRRVGYGIALWVLAGCCFAHAEETVNTPDTTEDWPIAIARLRQQMYQHPGFSSIREQLAVAYNNYAVSLGNEGRWDMAVEQLQEAIKLDGASEQFSKNLANIYLNKAHDMFKRHKLQEAKEAANQATALNAQSAEAYLLLGEIEYSGQRLKEAKAAWQRSLELDPSQTELAKRFLQVTEELPVESKFERLAQAYFDLRYEEGVQQVASFDIRDALFQARREVGSDFSYWPTHKTIVLIYSAASFHALRQETPDWVGGQFDGKIRVPLPDGQLDPSTVKQILYHEYTHALIYDLSAGKCATWLNEGLAEYEGRRGQSGLLTQLTQAFRSQQLVPWAELSSQFSAELPVDRVALAYQEAHSVAAYLISRYGFWRIRRILKAIGNGTAWERALSDEYHITPARLEANWRGWLTEFLQLTL